MASSQEVKDGYTSTLQDLTCNSKPLISVLTMLAEENVANAKEIVAAIEEHLAKVRTEVKLPVLYLIDCIIKNVGGPYTTAFCNNIVNLFCSVFAVVDEKTRTEMYKLRQTWNEVIPKSKLYALDLKTSQLDPAWPITAAPPNIHFNPKFLNPANAKVAPKDANTAKPVTTTIPTPSTIQSTLDMQQKLILKQKQLLDLQQKKLELELLQTQVKLQEQIKKQTDETPKSSNSKLLLKPEVAKQLLSDKKDESAKAMLAQINQRFPLANPLIAQMQSGVNQLSKNPNVRPAIRDPRLLRQQTAMQGVQQLETNSNNTQNAAALDNNGVCNKSERDENNMQCKNKVQPRIPMKKRASSPPKSSSKSLARHLKPVSGPTINLVDSPKKIIGRSASKSPSKGGSSSSKHKNKRNDKRGNKRIDRRSPTKDSNSKNRNYRRQRAISISPEPEMSKDVDLRLGGPEKQESSKHDADGRKNAPKKRSSDSNDVQNNSKRNRADKFDALFGTEDVDLRNLSTEPERMITPPPPPIISSKLIEHVEKENTNGSESAPVLSLDVLRAKLANTTKTGMKSRHALQIEQHNLLEKFAKKDDDVKSQEVLMSKIMAQMEHQKRRGSEDIVASMTQPISDDEFDVEMVADESKEKDVSVKSRFESRYARDAQWKGKRSGFLGARSHRGRTDPWIRPVWTHPEDEKSSDAMEMASMASPPDASSCMSHENIKSINIDGRPRDIVFYGETAIAFMSPHDPCEISFQSGHRRVHFDEGTSYLLAFGDAYREVLVDGQCHRIRLGAPTREIYVDGNAYECIFGGPPIAIEMHCKLVMVKIDGPPPQVQISTERRSDLVAGKVSLIIDAKTIVTIYLDARLQTFEVDGAMNTLRFKDAFKTVLINDQSVELEFGGLPKGVVFNGRKHFIRFSVFPKPLQPGRVYIRDMEGFQPSPAERIVVDESHEDDLESAVENILPPVVPTRIRKSRFSDQSPERNSPNIAFGNIDSLLSIASSSLIPPLNPNAFQLETPIIPQIPERLANISPPQIIPPAPVAPVLNTLNINDLFQKLVATGIVSTLQPGNANDGQLSPGSVLSAEEEHQPQISVEAEVHLKPVSFNDPISLKQRQPALIQAFYTGMQCSSCGMRFAQENSNLYSQHLDWHFRQNRKGKKNIRKASSRKWFYSISDWSNYEEIEYLEDREKCYFENQQSSQIDAQNEDNECEFDIPSVPTESSEPDPRCDVCQEKFEQFYNEEKEEWHLRMAIRVEEKTYHPLCYDDYQASLAMDESLDQTSTTMDNFKLPQDDCEMREEVALIPGLDVEMTKSPNTPVIVDCESENTQSSHKSDERIADITQDAGDETNTDALTEKEQHIAEAAKSVTTEDAEDDDVVINEVEPEKIILDDYELDENGLIAGVVVKQEPVDDGFTDVENFKLGDPQSNAEKSTKQVSPEIDESFVDIGLVVPTNIASESTASVELALQDLVGQAATSPLDQATETAESEAAAQEKTMNALPQSDAVETSAVTEFCHDPLLSVSTIDGNLDCNAVQAGVSGRIKINISKPLPVIAPKENKDISLDVDNAIEPPADPTQPLPPGEEPVQLHLKPVLQGIELKQLPPVNKGSELTGLCSIM